MKWRVDYLGEDGEWHWVEREFESEDEAVEEACWLRDQGVRARVW